MSLILIGSSFVAGVVTFLAPCTLPLVPAYLGFIAGVAEIDLTSSRCPRGVRRKMLLTSILFIAGFSTVFITFGLLAGLAGSWVSELRGILVRVGGVFVIALGLFMVGAVRPSWLVRERRMGVTWVDVRKPYAGFVLGAAFACGWTPCIGPILGSILLLASSTETAVHGAVLLAIFSLGLGTPFLLVALLFSRATVFIGHMQPFLHSVSRVGGVLLILVGITLVTGSATFLGNVGYRLLHVVEYEQVLMRFL